MPQSYHDADLLQLPFSGLGPYLARLFIANTAAGYKGIYYLAIGLNGTSSVLWVLFYHPPDFAHLHRNRTVKEEVKEMDFGGIFLFIAGFFLFLLGLGWGGTIHPWTSGVVLGPLISGIAVLIAFGLYGKSSFDSHLFETMETDNGSQKV